MQARLIGTLAAACALAATTLPSAAGASNGSQDSVVGDGTSSSASLLGGVDRNNVRFSVHSGPNGEDPQGFVTGTYTIGTLSGGLYFPAGKFTGHAVCLSVSGNRAHVVAKLDEPILTAQGPADMMDLAVTDNGAPAGGENIDTIGTGFFLGSTRLPDDCSTSHTSYYPGGHGNAVVNDAS